MRLVMMLVAATAAGSAALAGEAVRTAEVGGEQVPVIPRVEAGPTVDGDISDPVWQKAAAFQLQHADAKQAGEPDNPTTVRVLTDADTLYFGFDCVEKHPEGPFIPKEPQAKQEKRIPDHLRVQLNFGRWGRAAWYIMRTSPFEKSPWMGGSVYLPVNYNGCDTQNSRRGYPNANLRPPSYRAKARVLDGRWTAEISAKLSEMTLYPADGIPDLAELNFFRIRVGEDRARLDEMLVWDEGPCAWRGFWPHVQSWMRMSAPERFQSDHGGALWDSIQPLWAKVVKLEVGSLKCQTTRRGDRLPEVFYDPQRVYTTFGYTKEEGNKLRLEWWWDAVPKRSDWKPTTVVSCAPAEASRTAEFVKKPAATRAGQGASISFAVKEPVDVAVAIVDGHGQVVRHLAAGMLGRNAPAPLKPDALEQAVLWDGKGDDRRPLPAGAYQARVSLGLSPVFEQVFKDAKGAEFNGGQSLIAKSVGLGTLEPANWSFHPHGGYVMQICANPANEEVQLCGRAVFDGATGKYLREVKLEGLAGFPNNKFPGELGVDRQGNYWVDVDSVLRRFKPDGSPVPFDALGSPVLPQIPLGHANPSRGFAFGGPAGDCYIVHHYDWRWNQSGVVSQIGSDGRVKQWGLVECQYPIACARADRAGNVYVVCTARPKGQMLPPDFPRAANEETAAFYGPLYGSLLKFPPTGGSVYADKGGDMIATLNTYGYDKKPRSQACKVTGAEWLRPGFSVITVRSGPCHCNCASGRFDLDPFERLWIPDAIRSRIDVVDTNGNAILSLGKYGSPGESRGSDIRFGYPKMVAATDGGCYVLDLATGRVVKLRLGYRAQESAPVVP